jgi:RNAse (barnase) inhibitor barstar
MRESLEELKHMDILDDSVTLTSSLRDEHMSELDALADAVAASVLA